MLGEVPHARFVGTGSRSFNLCRHRNEEPGVLEIPSNMIARLTARRVPVLANGALQPAAALAGARLGGALQPLRMLSTAPRVVSPPMVYISGEEMTRYCMDLILDQWVRPHVDVSAWEFYDLSCKERDDTEDKCLHDAVAAGARVGAIFKEPTVTPTEEQRVALGLRKAWGSPNGAMRRGWNGITISRDTIHIEGMELGFKRPVLFERHAVGGEYGASFKTVGSGRVTTLFHPADGGPLVIVDDRQLDDDSNAVVTCTPCPPCPRTRTTPPTARRAHAQTTTRWITCPT
jgi:hypothetical protein